MADDAASRNQSSSTSSTSPLTLDVYATLVAHVDHFPESRRDEVLERLGREPGDHWGKIMMAGGECLLAAVRAGDRTAMSRFSKRVSALKAKLKADETKIEDIGPRRREAAPPAPPVVASPDPFPVAPPLAAADSLPLPPMRGLTLDTPLRAELPLPPRQITLAPVPPPAREVTLEAPMQAHLAPPPAREVTLEAPRQTPHAPPATTTLVLRAPGASTASPGPRLSLQRYALFCAERANAEDAEALAEILEGYGLVGAREAAEAAAWNERFKDPSVLAEYAALLQRYSARFRAPR